MKVLMFSFDRSLVTGQDTAGGTLERHKKYAESCERLDIIVLTKRGFQGQALSDKMEIRVTNSFFRGMDALKAFGQAKKLYKKYKYDLVVCQDPFLTGLAGVWMKKKFGVKLIVGIHGDFVGNQNWLKERKYNCFLLKMLMKVLKQADIIRVVSLGLQQKLLQAGFAEEKIKIISTPLDVDKFGQVDELELTKLKQKHKANGEQILLTVGRFETEKNLPWLVGVFAEMVAEKENLRLFIIGGGRQESLLKNKIRNLGLENKIFIKGRTNHQDLTKYHYLSDVFVLPSLSESFGKVLLEAGACGRAVVASRTTGASELVRDGETGWLFEINNKQEFKARVGQLLDNQELAQKMGRQAKEYVMNNFDGQQNIEKIIKMWQELVDEKG